jgi:hypothetical protein
MRVAHRIALLLVVIAVLLALLLPRAGHANQSETFGDIVVRYSAISTDQLFPDSAHRYGIERSAHNGLVNIAIERKMPSGEPALIAANVSGRVADLAGHARPIRFRETQEEGAIDYLGEFPIDASGTYVFTIDVTPPGVTHPYTVKFNRDYVAD